MDAKKITITVTQRESKLVTAVVAHWRQIVRTVVIDEGRVIRPVHLDHPETLLAAASLRALFFDDTPRPMLITLLEAKQLPVRLETLETSGAMLMYSELGIDGEIHISDLFHMALFDKKTREDFPLDEAKPFVYLYKDSEKTNRDFFVKRDLWATDMGHMERTNASVSYQHETGISQYASITRRLVALSEWGNVRIGYLKDVPIRRKNIVCYVANKLGGVHYESDRFPRNEADAREFRQLATTLDWDDQAITHAGLICVAISCMELVANLDLLQIMGTLETTHYNRQDRLRRGELFKPSEGSAV